jgi:hypothetical protein
MEPMEEELVRDRSGFQAKAKALAILLGALATAVTSVYAAVRKPEEKVAKTAYSELQKTVDAHTKLINDCHNDVMNLSGYLQALRDARPEPAPAAAPPARVGRARPAAPVPDVSVLPPVPQMHAPAAPATALPSMAKIVANAEGG